MKNEYSEEEAAELLNLREKDIGTLRERVGINLAGKLSENNITAMKSYIKEIGYTPKKRGRPPKQKKEPYQMPCSPLGPDCG